MHKDQRPLRLRKETLRTLSPVSDRELGQVAGGWRPPPNTFRCTTSALESDGTDGGRG